MALEKVKSATDFVKSDYDKSVILDSVHADNLMSAVMNISAELWVVRRRLLIAEKLAEQKVFATAAAIDAFKPTSEQVKAWETERNDFIESTLGVLTRPGTHRLEAAAAPMSISSPPLRGV